MVKVVYPLWPSRHGGTRVLSATFGNDPIKLVEVGIKVKHCTVIIMTAIKW